MARTLTTEERRLWAAVARATVPLKGRDLPADEEVPAAAAVAELPRPPEHLAAPPSPRSAPALPPLTGLEHRTARALARGRRSADALIDLHGMTQAQAHRALVRFLHTAQTSGNGIVLVVTGKGAATGFAGADERGVLRRMVPHWLTLPDLRGIVLGFEEAGPRQGGGGALYVRLRRARGDL